METLLQEKEQSLRADGVELGERLREELLPEADTLLRVYASAALAASPAGGVRAVHGPVFHAWMALGAEHGPGLPVADPAPCPDGAGVRGDFRALHGAGGDALTSIVWHPSVGAFPVRGAIRQRWLAFGGEAGLGYPVSDELAADAEGRVRYTRFRPLPPEPGPDATGGAIVHWDGHTRVLGGAVGAAWCDAFRGRGLLPLSDAGSCEDGVGACAHFVEGEGGAFGSIHHHPATGAAYVRAGIRDRWLQLGGERGLLGYPAGTESPSHTGRATLQRFRDPATGALTGTIAEHPDGRAFAAYGPIHTRWMELGADGGPGDPFTDVFLCPDGVGTLVHFRDGAGAESSIYYTPQTGAHLVRGAIRDLWAELGWEQSPLGYPVDDETESGDGTRTARFQYGSIDWSAETGARVRE